MYVCMYVCMHACMHFFLCMYAFMYVCMHAYMYTYIYYIYICMCVCIYTCIYTYIYGYDTTHSKFCSCQQSPSYPATKCALQEDATCSFPPPLLARPFVRDFEQSFAYIYTRLIYWDRSLDPTVAHTHTGHGLSVGVYQSYVYIHWDPIDPTCTHNAHAGHGLSGDPTILCVVRSRAHSQQGQATAAREPQRVHRTASRSCDDLAQIIHRTHTTRAITEESVDLRQGLRGLFCDVMVYQGVFVADLGGARAVSTRAMLAAMGASGNTERTSLGRDVPRRAHRRC